MDTNLVAPGRIYLDSDMIFWEYPSELIDLYKKRNPFFMRQAAIAHDWGLICENSRIYEAIGIEPVKQLNGGLLYLGESNPDWDIVEFWAERLLKLPNQHNPNMLEQTLYSLIYAQQVKDAVSLSDSYYVAFKELPHVSILTHYVHLSKMKYMNTEQYRWFRQFKSK